MIYQTEITLPPVRRGCHLITRVIMQHLNGHLPETGMLNLFVKHTSCGLTINENADPDVLTDMSHILDHLVPERQPYYLHTLEGDDDMPAHAKSSLTGTSLTIPITRHTLNLGTWQGIYLCEYRDHATPRRLVLTVYS
ncbi:MAG: secondary thiamine-phosphate synthase enzyme YjbQ [Muribaculaceae bacterium]|nr:secondary thiamine-phosphate synthase enzyme YjbQ [Muribaculaceae bacterium]